MSKRDLEQNKTFSTMLSRIFPEPLNNIKSVSYSHKSWDRSTWRVGAAGFGIFPRTFETDFTAFC